MLFSCGLSSNGPGKARRSARQCLGRYANANSGVPRGTQRWNDARLRRGSGRREVFGCHRPGRLRAAQAYGTIKDCIENVFRCRMNRLRQRRRLLLRTMALHERRLAKFWLSGDNFGRCVASKARFHLRFEDGLHGGRRTVGADRRGKRDTVREYDGKSDKGGNDRSQKFENRSSPHRLRLPRRGQINFSKSRVVLELM